MNMLRRKGFMPNLLWGTGLGIVIIVCAVVVLTVSSKTAQYKSQLEDRDAIIAQLTQQWEELGPAVQGLVAIKDISGGQEIRPDNWQEYFAVVNYPEKLNLKVAQPSMFTSNKYIRASMGTGTVLIADNILDERLDDSQRYYDVILDEYPVGMLPGKYIDIRIRFPFGQDFIALPHKKVEQINGSVIKLVLSEQEIYTYNSMLTDKVLYQAQLYAVEYLDTGAQQAADSFYPLNYNMQELLMKNPNALDIVRTEMKLAREILESEMLETVPADQQQKEAYYRQLQQQLASLRASHTSAITGQQAIFLARWAQEQAAGVEGGAEGAGTVEVSPEYVSPGKR